MFMNQESNPYNESIGVFQTNFEGVCHDEFYRFNQLEG